MSEGDGASDLLALIEAAQSRLRDALAGREPSRLAERPPSGKWSVLENVRHLLFAEQAHLGRFAPERLPWSPLGFTPETMQRQRRLPPLDGEATADVQEVLRAWEAVHAATRGHVQGESAEIRKALWRNLRHLRAHIEVIERLLRALTP